MENFSTNCPQCQEPYSIRLPSTRYYSRCGLPLTLQCGHGVCYHCIVSKRPHRKHGSSITTNKCLSTTISCAICHAVSIISRDAVRNVLALINCYQLGLIQLEELAVEVAGENIGFKDGNDGLFVPSSPQLSLKTTPFNPPEKCPIHSIEMEFWCYEDEVLLCRGCRIDTHLQHDVVKFTDRSKEEMDSFCSVADETVQLVDDLKRTCEEITEQTKRVQLEYDTAIKEMRRHFSDLHTILSAREQQVQHQLFGAFQERTEPLKYVKRYLLEASQDISSQLQKAATAVHNQTPPSRSSITRWTESIRQFNTYEAVIKETVDNLRSVTLATNVEPIPEYAKHLLQDPVASVRSFDEGLTYWTQLQNQYGDLKLKTNRQLVENLNSKSPCEQTEKKARKHPHVTPSSIAANHPYDVGSELTGCVVYNDAERFYIHIKSDTIVPDAVRQLDQLHKQIQTCVEKGAPEIEELYIGEMVVGLYQGTWYRSLIEDINLKCDDVVIFFIDFGNRELTTIQSIRLFNHEMMNLPAHAICCALTNNATMSELVTLSRKTKSIHLQVDRIEQGGVGRLDGPELTFWVTLCKPISCQNFSVITTQSEPMDPSVDWPPPKLHKIQTIPLPPPPEAMRAKRKRFPAKDWVPSRNPPSIPAKTTVIGVSVPMVLPLALNNDQENRHRTKVIASQLNSTGDFYVRVESAQKTYLNLVQQLATHFSISSELLEKLKPDAMATGLVCAVQMDGHWHRGRIVGTVDGQISVYLIDVGKKVNSTQLYRLDQPRWMATPAMALHCRLWGIRPAGHATKWSGSSFDKMKDAIKRSSGLFIQVYFIQEEEIEDSGIFSSVHYVRFYYEYIRPGGPMEFDQTLTCCLNDDLLRDGLALRDPMPVTVQPSPNGWLPSICLPPELENAVPVWLDDDGLMYIHQPPGPTNHVSVINKLLEWHYSKSTPTAADLAHWIKDEPCVVLDTDMKWYRAVVLSCDDETRTASVFFVDYGNSQQGIAYEKLRKSLLCYEYPIQANKCRLAKFPVPGVKPAETELATLHELLIDKRITVRLIDNAINELTGVAEPVVDIRYTQEGGRNLDEMFYLLTSGYRYNATEIIEAIVQSPPLSLAPDSAPIVPLSSVDPDDSIFDADSSGYSDDVYPIFNFDLINSPEFKEVDLYRQLYIPSRVSLPVQILSIIDESQLIAFVQPTRHSWNDSPPRWQEQVDGFHRLQSELQRSAPLFPDIEIGESKSPCVCKYSKDNHWYRGKIVGYINDDLSIVKVELVDIGVTLNVTSYDLKQLPTEYLNLPRHSTVSRLIDCTVFPSYPPDLEHLRFCMKKKRKFMAFFKELNRPPQMKLFCRSRRGINIPAIE